MVYSISDWSFSEIKYAYGFCRMRIFQDLREVVQSVRRTTFTGFSFQENTCTESV